MLVFFYWPLPYNDIEFILIDQVKQIWGSKPSGLEANETQLHPGSTTQHKAD